jgi:hypothetical protein
MRVKYIAEWCWRKWRFVSEQSDLADIDKLMYAAVMPGYPDRDTCMKYDDVCCEYLAMCYSYKV